MITRMRLFGFAMTVGVLLSSVLMAAPAKATGTVHTQLSFWGGGGSAAFNYNTQQVQIGGVGSNVVPTGTVTLWDGSTPLDTEAVLPCTPVPCVNLHFSGLPAGDHTIRATYNGDDVYAAGDSVSRVENFAKRATAYSASTDGPPSEGAGCEHPPGPCQAGSIAEGTPITFFFTVRDAEPNAKVPFATGKVTFSDWPSNALVGTAMLVSGTAKITTSSLAPGTHNIQAADGGDSNFAAPLNQGQLVPVKVVAASAGASPVVTGPNRSTASYTSTTSPLGTKTSSTDRNPTTTIAAAGDSITAGTDTTALSATRADADHSSKLATRSAASKSTSNSPLPMMLPMLLALGCIGVTTTLIRRRSGRATPSA